MNENRIKHNLTLERLVRLTQTELFELLCKKYRYHIAKKDGYILVKGNAPIMLVAHMDTVHREPVSQLCRSEDGNILMSPQGLGGDDRCGVYALCKLYESKNYKPWLLFTCNEEIGCKGAYAFRTDYKAKELPPELKEIKCIVEIDRRGKDDAVYYDNANDKFEEYITSKGFQTQFGSCSDISIIGPALKTASVNLSSGYFNEHHLHEHINKQYIEETIRKVRVIIKESMEETFPHYEHVERPYTKYERYPYTWASDVANPWAKYTKSTLYTKNSDDKEGVSKSKKAKKESGNQYKEQQLFNENEIEEALYEKQKEKFLEDIPINIYGEYMDLMDYAGFEIEDLEAIRQQEGDDGIIRLHMECFPEYYDAMEIEEMEDDYLDETEKEKNDKAGGAA